MIHGRTRLIYAILLAPFFVEGAQAALEAQGHVLAARQLVKGSPTSSSTSTSATPTNRFFLGDFPQPTSCGSSRIPWLYTGTANSLTLQVSNVGIPQDDPSSSSSSTSSTSSSDEVATSIIGRSMPQILISSSDITLTIATNLTPSSRSFLWNPVNVPEGWYIISAQTPGISVTQNPSIFFVRPGTDTSCLVAISSSTSSTPITPSSVNTATSIASQSVASTSLSTTSNTVNVPVIVGVSIGMAAFVIAVVALWLCLYRKAKSHRRGGRLNTFAHRWNGLGSADSRAGFAAKATKHKYPSSRSHLHSHPDSDASTMGPDFDGVVAEKSATQLNNGKTSNLSEEQGVALSTLPVLYHQPQRTRPTRTHSQSSSTSNVNVFSTNNHAALPSVQRSSQKRPSIDSSACPLPSPISHQALRDSPQYTVAPNMSHSHSLSTTGTQHSQQTSQQSYSSSISPQSSLPPPPPISPSATASREIKQMNRQSLGRKRKPVPVYDPDQEQPASATSTYAPPFPSSTMTGDSAAVPSLTHKSSFGPGGIEGKPLHYLIPDMPMPPVNP